MSIPELEHYSKDELIAELINRTTFAGVVIFHRGDAKAGHLEPGETVITKSPPLPREEVERLLQIGQSLVPGMFGDATSEAFSIHSDQPPLRVAEGGVVRVGRSRVSLDLIVTQYENGMTPEDLVRAYDTLELADVYAAIAYYLRHRDEVRSYLTRREEEAKELRTRIERERPPISRDELLARRSAAEKANAAAGQ